jgi:hypothetical protein
MKHALIPTVVFLLGIAIGAMVFRGDSGPLLPERPPSGRSDDDRPERGSEPIREAAPGGGAFGDPRAAGGMPKTPPNLTFDSGSADYLEAIRVQFEKHGGKRFPDDVTPAILKEAEGYLARVPGWTAGTLVGWARIREKAGVMGDPPDLLIQARGTLHITLNGPPTTYKSRKCREEGPLDVAVPWRPDESPAIYRRGGAVPFGKFLLVERVELSGNIGPKLGSGLKVVLDGREVFDTDGEQPIGGAIHGPVVVDCQSPILGIWLVGGAVEARVAGRILSAAEAKKVQAGRPRWAPQGSDGYLKTGRVLLQVCADHGGGNDRTVRLDGSTYRVETVRRQSIWNDQVDVEMSRGSIAHVEGIGLVPPGKVFRITRIDYRARLSARKGSHSKLVIEVKGRKVVEIDATKNSAPSGSWFGPVDIRSGDEDDVELTCPYFGLGEAVIWGEIVDPD